MLLEYLKTNKRKKKKTKSKAFKSAHTELGHL